MNILESVGPGDPEWVRSSHSNGAGGECVECAATDAGMLIRDSKSKAGLTMTVAHDSWRSFIRALTGSQLC
ncbi:DUF397 domain-containing protein [Streptomyces violaceus]|uniref:DUF397 domain-containing protein n=1 Tax=Streptomyces violaceus TaxID=1936 RepID=UPI003814EEE8